MTINYKVLGQAAPTITTLTTLYTAPAATQSVGSTLVVCNRGAATTFRLAVRPAGAAIANEHYLSYDAPIGANDSVFLTLGLTLNATDVVSIYAGTVDVSFSLFGSEITG